MQYLDDLCTIGVGGYAKHKELMQNADIIFVEAKKRWYHGTNIYYFF